MQGRPRSAGQAALRDTWCRWTEVVELFAGRRRARRRISPAWYQALRRQLLDGCRSRALDTDEVGRAFYQTLENLVQPWMTPQTLEQAEGEILHDLLDRCGQMEQSLGGRRWSRSGWRWAVVLLLLVGVGLVGGLLAWNVDGVWSPLVDRLGGWWRAARGVVERSSATERWIVGGAVLVLFGMYWVTRTPPT
jgi:hypothetical protein